MQKNLKKKIALEKLKKITLKTCLMWGTVMRLPDLCFALLPRAAQTAQTEEFMFNMWLIDKMYIKLGT